MEKKNRRIIIGLILVVVYMYVVEKLLMVFQFNTWAESKNLDHYISFMMLIYVFIYGVRLILESTVKMNKLPVIIVVLAMILLIPFIFPDFNFLKNGNLNQSLFCYELFEVINVNVVCKVAKEVVKLNNEGV